MPAHHGCLCLKSELYVKVVLDVRAALACKVRAERCGGGARSTGLCGTWVRSQRNYRTFLLFVYTSTILCLYVIGVCLTQLFLKHRDYKAEEQAKSGDTGDQ